MGNMLRPVKDNIGLKTPVVYKIPCQCGQVYIGNKSLVESRVEEHKRHLRLYYPEKSAVVQHSIAFFLKKSK
ncbi:hypothetical protein C0J52_04678 [Blattella germanica]|nr:hypothetical protein C0J52_04678 [Blattella germanica]